MIREIYLVTKGKVIYTYTKKETNTQACLSGLCTVPGPGGGIQAFVATDTGRWEIRLATIASSIERTEHAALRPRWLPSREKNLDARRRLMPFKWARHSEAD